MRSLGGDIGARCVMGDVIVLVGELGAGKTTLMQGLAIGLGITDVITSPTFVIARVHQHPGSGPLLVHMDAYRLSGAAEVDDLDLPIDLAVTVVEWGAGVVEHLSADRLTVEIAQMGDSDVREVRLTGTGRWSTALTELSGVST
jgi:tRNA threonylcarbamoyladenosine biosynthesis protein TsaE